MSTMTALPPGDLDGIHVPTCPGEAELLILRWQDVRDGLAAAGAPQSLLDSVGRRLAFR